MGIKKKIVIFALDFPPSYGGIQTSIYNVCSLFSPEDIIVLAYPYDNVAEFDSLQDFKILRPKKKIFKKRKNNLIFYLLWCIFKLIQINFKYGIKVVLCGHVICGYPLLAMRLFFRPPFVVYVYGLEVMHRRRRSLRKLIFRYASYIIVHSEFSKLYLKGMGIRADKIRKIYPAIDILKFSRYAANTSRIKDEYNLKGSKVILTVGRLTNLQRYKGQDMVIRALPKVIREVPNLKYLIAGSGSDAQYLFRLVNKLGLNDYVIFAGEIKEEELAAVYAASDIYIMCSRMERNKDKILVEGFGIVFLEANACGKPVIAGNSGGIPEAVIDGVTGLLVDPNSTEAVSEAIIRLLKDEGLARRMAEAGRKRVEEEFSLEVVRRKTMNLIDSIS